LRWIRYKVERRREKRAVRKEQGWLWDVYSCVGRGVVREEEKRREGRGLCEGGRLGRVPEFERGETRVCLSGWRREDDAGGTRKA